MLTLPAEFLTLISPYAALFSKRVFNHVQLLVTGAILTPAKRTITAVLRIMGRQDDKAFHKYHRVLSDANWLALKASPILLRQILTVLVGDAPLVIGIDETIERRWGANINARAIYRDPVRSSDSHFVKCSGLRWMSVMVLTKIGWANRVWALPFLTALCPSEGFYQTKKRAHKPLTDWARQLLLVVKRWVGERKVIAVADSSYAVISLLHALMGQVSLITRLRLDAALYEPTPPVVAGRRGRKRLVGKRLPTLQKMALDTTTRWESLTVSDWYGGQSQSVEYVSQTAVWYHTGKPPISIRWVLVRWEGSLAGFVSNDPTLEAADILAYFVRRWSVETTFGLVRAHLGVETQRQWSDKAISRTTPVLLGLFTLVTLMAQGLSQQDLLRSQSSTWYVKAYPTFSDALACVRRHFWQKMYFQTSGLEADVVKLPLNQFQLWENALAWAA